MNRAVYKLLLDKIFNERQFTLGKIAFSYPLGLATYVLFFHLFF